MSNIDRAERRRLGVGNQATRWDYSPNHHFPDQMEPGIEVVLIGPKARGLVRGVIDSGAGTTGIPVELAGQLGVDLSQAATKTAYGNSAVSDVLYPAEPLSIVIAGCTIELREPVFGGWGEILLGRADVFRHFRVLIDERAQQFVLDPYTEPEAACP